MKRTFYIFLMIILSVMVIISLYYCTVYGLVINRMIPLRSVITFTDITLSWEALGGVAIVGIFLGYRFGVKWWQIIYVDKVYYFDTPKESQKKRRTKKSET